jgi:hypothetical protein
MKKNYTILSLLMIFVFAVNAQVGRINPNSPSVPYPAAFKGKLPSVMAIDTLNPPSFGGSLMCDTAFRCYDFDYALPVDSGYVFGNSKYNGTEAAQKYYASGTINEVLVMYGKKAGTTGSTHATVYSVHPTTKLPMSLLGTSTVVVTGNITANVFTSYKFVSPVTVASAFAVGVVFPPNGVDTVGITSTKIYCSTTDTLAFIKFPSLGGWMTCPFAYSVPYDPTANLDLLIYPVINVVPTDISTLPTSNGLTLLGAYPNPAADRTTISYEVNEASVVSVEVFDLTGRIIHQSKENLPAGKAHTTVDVKNLSTGNYYYTVQTPAGKLTSKFSVVK